MPRSGALRSWLVDVRELIELGVRLLERADRFARFHEQLGVVERDRGLRGDAADQLLGLLGEHARFARDRRRARRRCGRRARYTGVARKLAVGSFGNSDGVSCCGRTGRGTVRARCPTPRPG